LSQLFQHKSKVCLISNVDCPLYESGMCDSSCIGLIPRHNLNDHVAEQRKKLLTLKRTYQKDGYCREHAHYSKKLRTELFEYPSNKAPCLASIRPTLIEDNYSLSSIISSLTTFSTPLPEQPGRKVHTYKPGETNDNPDEESCLEVDEQVVQKDKFTRYTGQVNAADQRHGRGRLEFQSGNVYEGDFKNDKRHGRGSFVQLMNLVMSEGRSTAGTYNGDWVDDIMEGSGVYRFTTGDVYEGHLHHGEISGQGKMTYVDGSTFEGKWHYGRWSGRGVAVDAHGIQTEGMWKNSELVQLFTQTALRGINKVENCSSAVGTSSGRMSAR
jgi:hypothetical protein